MNGLDAALVITLFVVLTIGLGVGGILAARSPDFWAALGKSVLTAALPRIIEVIAKRNPPDVEARMQECYRRGGEWDNIKKRCRD